MTDPQWQQGNQPYQQQHGQEPVPPQGQPAPGYPGQPGHPPAAGGWPGQAPDPRGFPPGPPYGQPMQPGYPPQQGFPPPQPGWPGAQGFPPQPPKPNRTGLILGSVVGAVLLVGAIVFGAIVFWPKGEEAPSGGGGDATAPTAATENYGVVVGSGPTKVDIWLDFQCPACKSFHDANTAKITELSSSDRITVVYHPVNFLDRTSPDEYSTRAASAALCAADDGQFEAYAGFLFANQPAEGGPGLTEEELVQAGSTVGGVSDAFADCVRTVKYREWIAEGTAAFTAGGVPTVHIDGTNVMDLDSFADALTTATA